MFTPKIITIPKFLQQNKPFVCRISGRELETCVAFEQNRVGDHCVSVVWPSVVFMGAYAYRLSKCAVISKLAPHGPWPHAGVAVSGPTCSTRDMSPIKNVTVIKSRPYRTGAAAEGVRTPPRGQPPDASSFMHLIHKLYARFEGHTQMA